MCPCRDGLSQSVRSDSIRPAAPPPELPDNSVSRPNSPLPLVTASDRRPETGPSRSILSEQLSRGAEEQAIARGEAKAVPQLLPHSVKASRLHASASEPVLPQRLSQVASAGPDGGRNWNRGFLSHMERQRDDAGSDSGPVDGGGSLPSNAGSPAMSGEFNLPK